MPFATARSTSDVISGARAIGVYWEAVRAAHEPEPTRIHAHGRTDQRGLDASSGRATALADPTTALSWVDEVPRQANGIAGRGVRVDLGQLARESIE